MAANLAGKITTDIPFRLDRLPWAKWHWVVVIGLGITWILDGLEVTIVGTIGPTLTSKAGLSLSPTQAGLAATTYLIGACVGALVFGWLTDRFGRKKLFLITLVWYLVSTLLTAFSWDFFSFAFFRMLAGAGHRRRVQRGQLGDRRADPVPRAAAWPTSRSTARGGSARCSARCFRSRCSTAGSSRPRSAGGWPSAWASCWRSRCCSCARASRRARAGCSPTAATTRPRRSSASIEDEIEKETGAGLPAVGDRKLSFDASLAQERLLRRGRRPWCARIPSARSWCWR